MAGQPTPPVYHVVESELNVVFQWLSKVKFEILMWKLSEIHRSSAFLGKFHGCDLPKQKLHMSSLGLSTFQAFKKLHVIPKFQFSRSVRNRSQKQTSFVMTWIWWLFWRTFDGFAVPSRESGGIRSMSTSSYHLYPLKVLSETLPKLLNNNQTLKSWESHWKQ